MNQWQPPPPPNYQLPASQSGQQPPSPQQAAPQQPPAPYGVPPPQGYGQQAAPQQPPAPYGVPPPQQAAPQQPPAPYGAPPPQGYGQQVAPHGVPQGQPPPGGVTAPVQQAPGASYTPGAEVMVQMRDRADAIHTRAQQQGQGRKKFFEIPGPGGAKFSAAYVGYEGERGFYFAGSYAEGKWNWTERVKRFWKSHQNPKGKTIYAGDDSLIGKAMKMLYDAGHKLDYLKPRREVVLQGFPMEYQNGMLYAAPQLCVDEQGKLRPMLYNMSYQLFSKLRKEVQLVGAMALQGAQGAEDQAFITGWPLCFNEDTGRPFLITKKKTGAEAQNVEYDIRRLEPMPLPQEYRPALSDMWQLDELFGESSIEAQAAALLELGIPFPPGYEQFASPSSSMVPPQQGYPQVQQGHPPQGYAQPQGYGMPQQSVHPPQGYAQPQPPAPPQSYQQHPNPPQQYQSPYGQPPPQQHAIPQGMPQPPGAPQGYVAQQPKPLPAYDPQQGTASPPPPAPPGQPVPPPQPAPPPPGGPQQAALSPEQLAQQWGQAPGQG